MSSQSFPTIGQATTIRKDGGAEFVTHDASIQPDRYTFANFDELNADGAQSVTFGDPVLDAISSAAGVLKSGSGRWLISSGGTAPWKPLEQIWLPEPLEGIWKPLKDVQFGRFDPNDLSRSRQTIRVIKNIFL
jgi:hypothetical protein